MENKNEVRLEMTACSQNEKFARLAAAGFLMDLNPTLMDMEDVKTAVSEAVTNAIIHGYGAYGGQLHTEDVRQEYKEAEQECAVSAEETEAPTVVMILQKQGYDITVIVEDKGKGIEDIDKAMQPMYTTRPEWERSGMGFVFMEAFMDSLEVESQPGIGTRIIMKKKICKEE